MKNFQYFLSLSTCHVFKKSFNKLSESSEKKPSNYYGVTKKLLEEYVLKNQNKYKFPIGIARIFNYYNKQSDKNFFINEIIDKLNSRKNIIKFKNVNTYRDYIDINDLNSALFTMIRLKLKNDYNICSGYKIMLKDIIIYLNKLYKNKQIFFDKKITKDLIGSNSKLKKKGWVIEKRYFLNDFQR